MCRRPSATARFGGGECCCAERGGVNKKRRLPPNPLRCFWFTIPHPLRGSPQNLRRLGGKFHRRNFPAVVNGQRTRQECPGRRSRLCPVSRAKGHSCAGNVPTKGRISCKGAYPVGGLCDRKGTMREGRRSRLPKEKQKCRGDCPDILCEEYALKTEQRVRNEAQSELLWQFKPSVN